MLALKESSRVEMPQGAVWQAAAATKARQSEDCAEIIFECNPGAPGTAGPIDPDGTSGSWRIGSPARPFDERKPRHLETR